MKGLSVKVRRGRVQGARRWRGRRLGVAAGLLISLAASSCDALVDIQPDPHTVDASRALGLEEAMVGATVDLYYAYDTWLVHTGRFGDEFFASSLDRGQILEAPR